MREEQERGSPEESFQEIEDRLAALKKETSEFSSAHSSSPPPVFKMMWIAFNVVSDLLAGIICGLGVGYGLDHWFKTRPVFIAVFLIIGCIAGILNVVRYLHHYNERQKEQQESKKGKE